MRALLLLAPALLVTACATPALMQSGAGLRVETEQTAYAPGAEVAVRIVNRTDRVVYYGACSHALERQTPEGWVPVPLPEVACIMIAYTVAPQETARYTFTLPPDVGSGTYRVVMALSAEGADAPVPVSERTSPPFTVAVG